MDTPHFNLVIFTSAVDAHGVRMLDEEQAERLFVLISRISPYAAALYRYDGDTGVCLRRHQPDVVAA